MATGLEAAELGPGARTVIKGVGDRAVHDVDL